MKKSDLQTESHCKKINSSQHNVKKSDLQTVKPNFYPFIINSFTSCITLIQKF